MTDHITIRDLKATTKVGVTDDERASEQTILITIEIETDLKQAGASDRLEDTVDYGRVAEDVVELVKSSENKLLEKLAERIAGHIGGLSGVERVTVELVKESPPVEQEVGPIAVKITRP